MFAWFQCIGQSLSRSLPYLFVFFTCERHRCYVCVILLYFVCIIQVCSGLFWTDHCSLEAILICSMSTALVTLRLSCGMILVEWLLTLKKSIFQSTLQCTQQWDIKSHLRPDEFSVHVSDPSWQSVSRQTVSHIISFCWNLLSDSIEILRNWEILGLHNSKWRSTYFVFLIWLIWCVIR